MPTDPNTRGPKPPQPPQQQQPPGLESEMDPKPDFGLTSYKGSGKLKGKVAIITGGDSGIGRAVALAYAREGADVVISYLNEHSDAEATKRVVEVEGRKCLAIPGDIQSEAHCRAVVDQTVRTFGKVDILVANAAYQMTRESLDEITEEEFDRTFRTNVYATFFFCKAAVPHMPKGGSIIITVSVNVDKPRPTLLPYASTKGALQNLSAGLAQLLAEKGIRVNCVAPGPVWTPLIPSTMPPETVAGFGENVPFKRAAQPAELAPPYVMLASDEASYISGATIAVTGGKPII
jgi:NAD(P)-dependent dehydrogenase (short-subunit alcohol dehydrogenase family)